MIEIGKTNENGEWVGFAGPYATIEDARAAFDRDWRNNPTGRYEIRQHGAKATILCRECGGQTPVQKFCCFCGERP